MAEDRRTPDWLLERLLAGELDAAAEAKVRARLAAEEGGLARLAALEADNAATLASHPPEAVAREVGRRLRQAEGDRALASGRRIWAPLAAITVAAAALFIALPQGAQPGAGGDVSAQLDSAGDTRIKGLKPSLIIHRKMGKDVEQLDEQAQVEAGDKLQVSYNSAGEPFGVIFSIDGSGVVTLHHPREPGRSGALTTTGLVALPRSYQLDDAPAFERFFLITSDAPFDLSEVTQAARDLAKDKARAAQGALPLPKGLNQTSLTLRKVER